MQEEEFFPLKDYEGLYSITRSGKVWSHSHVMFKNTHYDKMGYKKVTLYKKNIQKVTYIHKILAQTFIVNHDNKKTINHINGIKDDNRLENLEWCTQKENVQHAHKTGLCNNHAFGERNGSAKLTDEKVRKIYGMYKKGYSVKLLSKKFNVTIQTIYCFIKGETWKHLNLIKVVE